MNQAKPQTAVPPTDNAPRTNDTVVDGNEADARSIRQSILRHLQCTLGELPRHVDSSWEPYVSLALAVRDRMIANWIRTQETYYERDAKRVYYLSLEFLMGRTLGNAMLNVGITDACAQALHELGYSLEDLRNAEWDAGLGNGGLGRLAACFLDSLATLQLPAYGYGIRYEYGIFHQRIIDGAQVEVPDTWLEYGNPWEIARLNDQFTVHLYGHVHLEKMDDGNLKTHWINTEEVVGIPYDTPVPGYQNGTVNTLRLWQARAGRDFDFRHFNAGDYRAAVDAKMRSENISKVLYPNDNVLEGKELRLKQEYFFVSATLQDIIRRYKKQWRMHDEPAGLPLFQRFTERVAVQLNDTHPALAIPELMRILLDEHGLSWDEAWRVTTGTFAYTNHTVMPEALERWPVWMVGKVLPRHLQLIFEINHRFLQTVRERHPGDDDRCRRLSIVEEGDEQRVRMANLAIVGSHSVNGVAALHTEILKTDVFADFVDLWPLKFHNKTNGVTQRRWLLKANPGLSGLITEAIGDGWITDLYQLKNLVAFVDDAAFQERWRDVKRANKERLITEIVRQYRRRGEALTIPAHALFDCQVKRIHEYKRQLLNALHAITLYNRIKERPRAAFTPRVILFSGKAAPGYHQAKLIIRLINAIGRVVNHDPDVADRLKVVFLSDYRVSLAEKIFPAADLSEQISTAGTEASGTGNMKFALNGALTIGTMDGANVELAEEIGRDHMFLFGLSVDDVKRLRPEYSPRLFVAQSEELRRVLDQLRDGAFSPEEPGLFRPIVDSLLSRDEYLLLADYDAYVAAQEFVSAGYREPGPWTRKSIWNVAHTGKFSTDRTIAEYARDIWGLHPVRP
ncbi:MAG: glycogen/starch/alpha-glucan phosphorylase [Deltaproteobacteria bacterium]|nr:glycogen/starch/alpha-glucan phosphorylase [Deltaproteobacteria bacterium]